MEVSPFGLTTLTMSPQYLTGKRSVAQLAFNNRSNSALCYELHASDLEEGLDCLFDPDTVTVPPGEEATASIAVRPRRRPFFGSLHEYPFVVVAAPPGQEDDQTALSTEGVFAYEPPLAKLAKALGALWRRLRAAIPYLLPLLVLALCLAAPVRAFFSAPKEASGPPRITHLSLMASGSGPSSGALVVDYGFTGKGSVDPKSLASPVGSGSLPLRTDRFGLVATGPEGNDLADLEVAIAGPPVIVRLLPTTKRVTTGEAAELTWMLLGAEKANIDGVPIPAGQLKSGQFRTPPVFSDTVFILTAANGAGEVSAYAVVESGPAVVSFVADPATITSGESSNLKWVTKGAASAAIDQSIGAVDINGSRPVSPTEATNYILTVSNAFGRSVTATVSTKVLSLATVTSFAAKPPSIGLGGSSSISWQIEGAVSVSIDQGIGTVEAKGAKSVSPTKTTTYTLSATNSAGRPISQTATVSVVGLPQITCAASSAAVTKGESVTLKWQAVGVTSVSIDQGVGEVEVAGSRSFNPEQPTTWVLTASNIAGSSACKVAVNVVAPPAIVTFEAAPLSIPEGGSSVLSWQTTGAAGVSIDQSVGGVGETGSKSVSPAKTTTYIITVKNALGLSVTRSVTVNVGPVPQLTCSASPAIIVGSGASTLTWRSTGATSISIDNGIGTVGATGTVQVSLKETTTYTFSAVNSVGTAKCAVTVTVTPAGPDLVVTSIQALSTAVRNRDSSVDVPIRIVIKNQGGVAAGVFKISTHYGPNESVVAFTVPRQNNLTYPFTSASLAPGASVTFDGNVHFTSNFNHGATTTLWAVADSCAGEVTTVPPPYCRVQESDEGNNKSVLITPFLP
ncbi:MAG: hypothetical protein Q7O66_01865 [Dehalococcoidia bacterium]|nr:hypothetical protein [Dehalococcoidia bacterium]